MITFYVIGFKTCGRLTVSITFNSISHMVVLIARHEQRNRRTYGGSNNASSDNIDKNPKFLYADRPTDSIFVASNDGNICDRGLCLGDSHKIVWFASDFGLKNESVGRPPFYWIFFKQTLIVWQMEGFLG